MPIRKQTNKPPGKNGKYDELIRFLKTYPDIEAYTLFVVKHRKKLKNPSLSVLVRKIIRALSNSKHSKLFTAMLYFCSK